MKKYLFGIFIINYLINLAYAQETPPNGQKNPETPLTSHGGWISDGKELGRWWTKNPKKYQPIPEAWLYHAEGSYAFSDVSGNIVTKSHKADINLILRQGLFTGVTVYSVNRRHQSIVLLGNDFSIRDYFFKQGFRFALTDIISAVVGGTKERNTDKYVSSRQSYFSGIHLEFIDTPKMNVESSLFYGQADMSFMNDQIQSIPKYSSFPSVEDYQTNLLDLYLSFSWQLTDMIGLSVKGDYTQFLKDSDYFLWDIDLRLDFKLTERTFFFTSYTINHEETPFVISLSNYLNDLRAKGKVAGEMKTENTILAVGIKFVF